MAVLPCGRHVPKLGNLHQHVQTSRERQGASICAQARVCAQRRGTGIRCPCAAISNGIFLAVLCVIGSPPDIQKSADCCIIMHNMVRENRRYQYTVLQWLARKNNDDDRDVSDKCPVPMCSMCRWSMQTQRTFSKSGGTMAVASRPLFRKIYYERDVIIIWPCRYRKKFKMGRFRLNASVCGPRIQTRIVYSQ